ncbi:MAG TPA: alpha-ribazole phosphatase family protein [Puia sp.]|nr:alpha-ribazole phosphatase family protein [Puia sp.]
MEIYLIRHTTPAVAKGICYGQTDLDVTASFHDEAAIIREKLRLPIRTVHSSPLQRCRRLAEHLFPDHLINLHDELMEIHCGQWEMKSWNELPEDVIGPWMKDFVNVRIPGGESYLDLHERVNRCFQGIWAGARGDAGRYVGSGVPVMAPVEPDVAGAEAKGAIAIVAHGGVIRSILSAISGTPLIDSFAVFALHFGCVAKISDRDGVLQYEIISNIAPGEKEQHKPSPR